MAQLLRALPKALIYLRNFFTKDHHSNATKHDPIREGKALALSFNRNGGSAPNVFWTAFA